MDQKLASSLGTLLADYQVFYQKMRGYHWNVTGPLFFGLHAQFEALYDQAALRVDELAERLAAGDHRPPSSLAQHLELARLKEDPKATDPTEMVRSTVSDLERLNGWLRETARQAEGAKDTATMNLLDGFADEQEKSAWMLKAFLKA